MSWIISNALMRDYENSLYSQEQAAESLGANSLDGEQSAPSNGSHTPLAFLPPDKMTAFSRLSRSGMTFAPLTDDRGEDVLTWFLAGFPARTSVALEMARESTASEAASGLKCLGSLAKWDRDTSLWRTHQFSLLGDLEPFSETWPRWGMMRGGECWELLMPVRLTSENESGLWPTPCANETGEKPEKLMERMKKYGRTGSEVHMKLSTKVQMWPTPRSQDAKHGSCTDYELSRDKGKDLLHVAVERMRTWPTPVASMTKENQNPRTPGTKGSQTTLAIEAGGSLNPTWVEWLMGWPLGWTDLKPLETARFRQWCASHGKY
jgi:hypothetical protein